MLRHRPLAIQFAEEVSQDLVAVESAAMIREAVSDFREHKVVESVIGKALETYVEKMIRQEWLLPGASRLFDFEGKQRAANERQRHSYPLLGTWAHPDAAVLSPFTVAFEFDREAATDTSHFKTCLMKAAVHVLSGAYEACVLVFALTRPGSSRETYIDDPSAAVGSMHLIRTLQAHGLVVAFVPPAPR